MARPTGAKDEQPWTAALRKALAERDGKTGPQKLERVANACVEAAIAGEVAAIKEIGDRLDGKPKQAQVIQGDPNAPVQHRVEHVLKRREY